MTVRLEMTGMILAACLAVICPVPAAASPEPLLVNSGFEAGVLSPWFQGGGTLDFPHDEFWGATTVNANTGEWSSNNVGNNELRQNFAPVAVSLISEVSLFLREESSFGVFDVAVVFYYLDGTSSQHMIGASQVDTWEQHDLSDDPEDGKRLVGVSLYGVRANVELRTYVDDFVITVPEHASPAVALAVLIAMARPRLRKRSA